MTTLAVLVIFAAGTCFGIFVICVLVASSRNEQTEPRPLPKYWARLQLVEEPPEQNLRNALQILGSFVFLSRPEQCGHEGAKILVAASDRIAAAVKQLEAQHRETA